MRGKAGDAGETDRKERDHPRLCGEKRFCVVVQSAEHGSPPPMRGKVWDQFQSVHIYGITPAYAGKRIRRRATKDDW